MNVNELENDLNSSYSGSTVNDSEIVARNIIEYERNQRLRLYGLLNINEERSINCIESTRNSGQSDRVPLVTEEEEQEISESSTGRKIDVLALLKNKYFLLLISAVVFAIAVISSIIFLSNLNNKNKLESTRTITEPTPVRQERATIFPGECLIQGTNLYSEKRCFKLFIDSDGDMVIHRVTDEKEIWKSDNNGGGYKACMQNINKDDNSANELQLLSKDNVIVWQTGKTGDYVFMQDNAQLTLKLNNRKWTWRTEATENC